MSFIEYDGTDYVITAPATPLPGATVWYTVRTTVGVERLKAVWPDAPYENLDYCDLILDTAREQVEAYAPAPGPEGYPRRMVYAQLQQAKNLHNAASGNSSGEIGGDGYSFSPRPLDKTIRTIIRPTEGVADVY